MIREKSCFLEYEAEERHEEDYLYESQIRYILSQLQMEFLEYRCVGMLESKACQSNKLF